MSADDDTPPQRSLSAELRLLGMPGELLAALLDQVRDTAARIWTERMAALPADVERAVLDSFRTHPALARLELPVDFPARMAAQARDAVAALVLASERVELAARQLRLELHRPALWAASQYYGAGVRSMQTPEAAAAATARVALCPTCHQPVAR